MAFEFSYMILEFKTPFFYADFGHESNVLSLNQFTSGYVAEVNYHVFYFSNLSLNIKFNLDTNSISYNSGFAPSL